MVQPITCQSVYLAKTRSSTNPNVLLQPLPGHTGSTACQGVQQRMSVCVCVCVSCLSGFDDESRFKDGLSVVCWTGLLNFLFLKNSGFLTSITFLIKSSLRQTVTHPKQSGRNRTNSQAPPGQTTRHHQDKQPGRTRTNSQAEPRQTAR